MNRTDELKTAIRKINELFGEESRLLLSVVDDWEGISTIRVEIETDRNVTEARQLIDRFYDECWLDLSAKIQGNMVWTSRFIKKETGDA